MPLSIAYHVPCATAVDIDRNELTFYCPACKESGKLTDRRYRIGVRTFSDWWTKNPNSKLPQIIEGFKKE